MGSESPAPSERKVLIFSCSGAANVGEVADEACRRLMFDGRGEMYCLNGLGGQLDEFIDKTRAADVVLLVDGCDKACGKQVMKRCGIEDFRYVCVTDLGIDKAKPKRAEEEQIVALQRKLETCL
ncbi:MAG: putative zinc-binding protein [Phycisphaerae bacterium]|nr:putative zinc-binding protein [Phycisphaerae bacterium]